MSIYDNVASGLKLNGFRKKRILDEVVERSLKQAALWDEVKDDLKKKSGASIRGQQQRLCIARALAVDPEVLLMDEPRVRWTPFLRPNRDLIFKLKSQYTIVIVTHNMQQAARVAENTGFFLMGKLVEFAPTTKIFTNPRINAPRITSQGGSDDTHQIPAESGRIKGTLLVMAGLVEQASSVLPRPTRRATRACASWSRCPSRHQPHGARD